MTFDSTATLRSLRRRPEDRLATFRSLPLSEQSAVLSELSPYVQQLLLKQLNLHEIVDVLDHMDLRAAEAILSRLKDSRRRGQITKRLKAEIREKVEYFLRFHPKATLPLVHFNYLYLASDVTIGEAGDAIDEHYQETGKFPEVLVHDGGVLMGEVSIAVLVRERNSALLGKYIRPVQTITYQAEVSQIIDTFAASEHKKIIVLDHDASVLGIVYADDVLDLFGDMPTESLYSFAGVDSSERPFDSALSKFKNRYRWLVLNLATAFFAGSVIFVFQDTINTLTILAIYIPIVAGMGGNAGSQTFAVMLRGITLGTISFKDGMPAVWKEVQSGLLNGVLIGSIVAIISIFLSENPWLGLVVALAMVAVHIVAGFFGALVPLIMKSLGKDPASTSMIFISTATDVFGILALLGFGTLILL